MISFVKGALAFYFILLSLFLFTTSAGAQEAEIASSLNPVGSGARATGMGGAFIGVADDATAASWNPAGLIQLEKPEISVVYSYFQRSQQYRSHLQPEIASDNSMDAEGLNYVSIVYPFVMFNRNITVSLNYQRMFEMDKDVSFNLFRNVFGEDYLGTVNVKQEGFLYSISPAIAVQIADQLYVGATLNLWDNYAGRNGWEKNQHQVVAGVDNLFGPFSVTFMKQQDVSFKGTNMNVGFLWMINDSFTLGGIYKTPFNAHVLRKTHTQNIVEGPVSSQDSLETIEELTLKMPSSYGLGLSYRHSDNWTIALDIYRSEWSRSVLRDANGDETIFISEKPASEGRLKNTTQVRLGTEYLFTREKDVIPLRFGILYDPEPQTGHRDEYFGFSFGTGYARGRVVFDIAYQYRFGKNLTGDIAGDFPSSAASDVNVDQNIVMSSLILYFE